VSCLKSAKVGGILNVTRSIEEQMFGSKKSLKIVFDYGTLL